METWITRDDSINPRLFVVDVFSLIKIRHWNRMMVSLTIALKIIRSKQFSSNKSIYTKWSLQWILLIFFVTIEEEKKTQTPYYGSLSFSNVHWIRKKGLIFQQNVFDLNRYKIFSILFAGIGIWTVRICVQLKWRRKKTEAS